MSRSFSIVTPSFRSSSWLKLCIASVADQQVPLEHIVQDAGSDDGTLDWLPHDQRVKAFIEKDQGMYDAVNRGLRRASGDILAYLNCDEQYLVGALGRVSTFFDENPNIDVLFGDIVLVDVHGDYLCHRKVQVPLRYHTWICHLSTLSCATFFRRRVFFDYGLNFDTRWRDAGDAEWMVRLFARGVKMAHLNFFTSAFTFTGANLSTGANARRENRELAQAAPSWAQKLKPLLALHHRLRKLIHGSYWQSPFTYSLYTAANPAQRTSRRAAHPSFRWPSAPPSRAPQATAIAR